MQARRRKYICDTTLKDFYRIAAETMTRDEVFAQDPIVVQAQFAPHVPPDKLPAGKLAVVLYAWEGVWLMVDGKVGEHRRHKFGDWHYDPKNSRCNLASLIKRNMPKAIGEMHVSDFMKEKVNRFNFLIPEEYGCVTQMYLQGFLMFKFFPKFRP